MPKTRLLRVACRRPGGMESLTIAGGGTGRLALFSVGLLGALIGCVSNVSLGATLIGDWMLNEDTGNVACDISGNSNNGTIQGSPTLVPGPSGQLAMSFNGNTYITIPNSSGWNFPSGFTITAWFNCGTAQPYPDTAIVSKTQPGQPTGSSPAQPSAGRSVCAPGDDFVIVSQTARPATNTNQLHAKDHCTLR